MSTRQSSLSAGLFHGVMGPTFTGGSSDMQLWTKRPVSAAARVYWPLTSMATTRGSEGSHSRRPDVCSAEQSGCVPKAVHQQVCCSWHWHWAAHACCPTCSMWMAARSARRLHRAGVSHCCTGLRFSCFRKLIPSRTGSMRLQQGSGLLSPGSSVRLAQSLCLDGWKESMHLHCEPFHVVGALHTQLITNVLQAENGGPARVSPEIGATLRATCRSIAPQTGGHPEVVVRNCTLVPNAHEHQPTGARPKLSEQGSLQLQAAECAQQPSQCSPCTPMLQTTPSSSQMSAGLYHHQGRLTLARAARARALFSCQSSIAV